MDTPRDAYWFGLEVGTPDAKGRPVNWVRISEDSLGGKWWQISSVRPHEVAARAAELLGQQFPCRVIWAPKDKRYKIGHSLPFTAGEVDQSALPDAPPPPAPSSQPAAAPPPPAAPQPPAAPPSIDSDPLPPPGAQQAFAALHTGNNGHNGSERAFQPPPLPPNYHQRAAGLPPQHGPPPGDLSPTAQFYWMHNIVMQDTQTFHERMTIAWTMIMEGERARSRETLEAERNRSAEVMKSMELHYATIDKSRVELQAVLAQAGRASPQLEALGSAVAQLGAKIEELQEDADDSHEAQAQLVKLSQDPNDLERIVNGIQNTISQVANSPLGQPLGEALSRAFGGEGAQSPQQDGAAAGDWEDVRPPEQ